MCFACSQGDMESDEEAPEVTHNAARRSPDNWSKGSKHAPVKIKKEPGEAETEAAAGTEEPGDDAAEAETEAAEEPGEDGDGTEAELGTEAEPEVEQGAARRPRRGLFFCEVAWNLYLTPLHYNWPVYPWGSLLIDSCFL